MRSTATRARPSTYPLLRWLGPWRFSDFHGQFESDRDYPEPLLFGMTRRDPPPRRCRSREPYRAQWCGDGRPCDLRHLLRPAGRQRQRPGSRGPAGNQLAGFDLRGRGLVRACPSRSTRRRSARTSGFLPSKYLGLFGSRGLGDVAGGSWRVHASTPTRPATSSPTHPSSAAPTRIRSTPAVIAIGARAWPCDGRDGESRGRRGAVSVDARGRRWASGRDAMSSSTGPAWL